MRVVLGGVRGSAPLSLPGFERFGGATTCVLADDGAGGRVVFDAGTGLRTVQPELASCNPAQPALLLLSHFHLDHLIGLPAFEPLYDPSWRLTIAAPPLGGVTAAEALARLITPPFWPAPFRARLSFVDLPATCDAPYRHGPFEVRWCGLHHTGGCHAYRLDELGTGASLVFATDFEWQSASAPERDALLRLCALPRPADLLVCEGHDDRVSRPGWGHSTWRDAVEIADAAGAGRLIVTHLAPGDSDDVLEQRERLLQSLRPSACLGRQGLALEWRKGTV